MGERVETGGLMSFDYSKSSTKKLSDKQKNEIEDGYGKYYERRRKEKRRRFILIILVIVVVVSGLLSAYLLR
jgi:cytoskeletal protein RodZ